MAVFVNSRHRRSLLGNRGRPKENRFGEDRQGVGLSRERKGLRRERGARAEGAQRESKKKGGVRVLGFFKKQTSLFIKKTEPFICEPALARPRTGSYGSNLFFWPNFLI